MSGLSEENSLEMYNDNRYFAFTGKLLEFEILVNRPLVVRGVFYGCATHRWSPTRIPSSSPKFTLCTFGNSESFVDAIKHLSVEVPP